MTRSARRARVFFCIDCSGSMAGDRIEAVNDALRSTLKALPSAAESFADVEICVRVLAFADKPEWRESPSADGFLLVAGGETNMGAALRELGAALACGAAVHPPAIILISDGLPTDDIQAGLAAFGRCAVGRGVRRIAIAVGADADLAVLQSFVGPAGLPPLVAHNPEMLRVQIEWAVGALVGAASPTLAAEAAERNVAIGEAIW
jgi:uncharacterized protein YegL